MFDLLRGIRVLDLTNHFTLAAGKLADFGADVIKVEQPPAGDAMRSIPPIVKPHGIGLHYLMLNRNKRSLALDLRHDEGRRILFELLPSVDVVIEGFLPGVADRLGIGYEALRATKPDLIYCALSGYGQTGPNRELPAHGMNIDAAAGMIALRQEEGQKPEIRRRSGMGVEEAALHAALGVATALFRRERTGQGQYLDVACWDGAVAYNVGFSAALNCGTSEAGSDLMESGGFGPRYDVYGTQDDKAIFLCVIEERFWVRFCTIAGRGDWVGRGSWGRGIDFGTDDPTLAEDLEAVMRTRSEATWMAAFRAEGVPASPVRTADDLLDDPHVEARAMVVGCDDPRYPDLKFVRPPVLLPEAGFTVVRPPPVYGEHSAEILAELGYREGRLEALVEAKVVVRPPERGA